MQPVNPDAGREPSAGAEPTPWITGLTVTVFIVAIAATADIALTRALSAAFGWLWIPANALLGIGLAPSIWLMRRAPLWRWIAYGVAVGLTLAWFGLLIGAVFGVRGR